MIVTNFKLYENKQKAESILRKQNIPTDDPDYKKIKQLLNGHGNYLGAFTKWFFVDKTNYETLEELYKFLTTQNMKLDRPIDTFDTAEEAYDYLQRLEGEQLTNKIINELTPKLKKLVGRDFINLISASTQYADELKDFYKKCKAYEPDSNDRLGIDALYTDTKEFVENLQGDFNAESIINKINSEKLNIDVVLDANTLLILNVKDYQSMKILGSKKWCIVKSENHWDNYVNGFTVQYMIFDFTKNRIDREHAIGVTVSPNFGDNPNNYTAIHWANDDADGLSKEYINDLGKKHGIK